MSDVSVVIAALRVYPVKSCAGIALAQASLTDTGLQSDRFWMVVDRQGDFVTQRQLPRMALIHTALSAHGVVLSAPGCEPLELKHDGDWRRCLVRVWKDEIAAYDMGEEAALWLSGFLGQALRVVRFDFTDRRLSNQSWTGDIEAANAFSDGYPILVTSQAGLHELNHRLALAGVPPVAMERFRPNLVLDGLDANGEDHLDELHFDTAAGPVRLKLVKPCLRCAIPDINLETAEVGHAVRDTLTAYRADARLEGAITFGMNAVILEGIGRQLAVGMAGTGSIKWD